MTRRAFSVAILLTALCGRTSVFAATRPVPEISYAGGKLVYVTDAKGNRVLDYSMAGYMGGGVAVPPAAACVTVPVGAGGGGGDATARLQAAIDYASSLPVGPDGMRGAVLLEKGRYPINKALKIAASGVVLRGAGQGADGTVLVATGIDRRTLIQIAGRNDMRVGAANAITDAYVPVNATALHVKNPAALHVGDAVQVRRPSTAKWIEEIGMFQFPGRPDSGDFRFSWRPGQQDVFWNRTVTALDGDKITLDAPLTSTLDAANTAAIVSPYLWPGLIRNVGVENLRCDSEFDVKKPLDEEHAWIAIGMESAQDCWIRQVTATHFCSSLASLLETTRRITVADCQSLDPVSEIGGYRRHSFYSAGQQTLFLRCHSEHGRHDYAFGYESTGPSAVVNCDATGSLDFSGTIESWASGILFDSVEIKDHSIRIENREVWDQGAGWSGVSCMLWNCQAPVIALQTPPGEKNWAFGCWGVFTGAGPWGVVNEWVDPASLYMQQLTERLGKPAVAAIARTAIPTTFAKPVEEVAGPLIEKLAHPPAPTLHPLALQNGWLTHDGQLLTGTQGDTSWWKGHVDPQRAVLPDYGPAITRFAPGRTGQGVTDDLDALTNTMLQRGQAAFAHNWGLWYDQRRQDHEQTHRLNGDVEPPFFEQAWARSGNPAAGVAFDGLSKYDLTQFNPWYFGRLRQFADLAQQKGLVLINQMYFQHHLLEDAAHWMDVPWRVTNAVQDIGLPEPPPILDRKRIVVANIYYDVTQPKLREFHRNFIRHELDNFVGNPNVIFTTGEEFNGPLTFVQFWIDTIAEWEKEKNQHPLIALCCTKDVQDAILADPVRSKTVDVIDMKYWWYTPDGMYNPPGGEEVAPRKQITAWRGNKSHSDEATARQVRDYRAKFPDKAIICDYDAPTDPWSVTAAGGSMVGLRADAKVLAALPRMLPWNSGELVGRQMALADKGKDYLVYAPTGGNLRVDLTGVEGDFAVNWVNPANGTLSADTAVAGGAVRTFAGGNGKAVLWLTRK